MRQERDTWSVQTDMKGFEMDEAQLQYEYIEKAKKIVREKAEEKGSKLTCCVVTFGCQMNTEVEIEKAA